LSPGREDRGISVEQRAHASHVAFLTLAGERSGGAVERAGGAALVAVGHPFPFLNLVIAEAPLADAGETMDAATGFFAARERPAWSVFTRSTGEDAALDAAAETRGLTVVNPAYPEMVCERPLAVPRVGDLELREIATAADAAAYWSSCRDAYATLGFPPEVFDGFEAGLLRSPARACLALLDGHPAGGASVLVFDGVAVVTWVATVAAARGRGVGAAVTAWVTNRAFDDGAELAMLQASPMGKPVYERLGYRTVLSYRVWRYASDAGQISR
jgi:GNAT superfamily N-acetyltransferase